MLNLLLSSILKDLMEIFGLSDLYFPQFNLSIEIDEGQHKNMIHEDDIRDNDYLLTTQELMQHLKDGCLKE